MILLCWMAKDVMILLRKSHVEDLYKSQCDIVTLGLLLLRGMAFLILTKL